MHIWRAIVVALLVAVSIADGSCERKLQGIIATPENCAEKYLRDLMRQLKTKRSLLFTPEADSVVQIFEQTYGVTVTLNQPYPRVTDESCYTFTNDTSGFYATAAYNTTDAAFFSFNNTELGNLPISNINVTVSLLASSVQATIMGIVFNFGTTSSAGLPFMLFQCGAQASWINATFADGGAPVDDNCNNLGDGLVLQAYTNMMATIQQNHITFATPMQFVVANPPNGVYFSSVTMTLCTKEVAPPYTSTWSKSNLNVLGFRKSEDTYYSTAIFYDSYGRMLYVTISVPATSVSCLSK